MNSDQRVILHSDMNNCFAAIELLHQPKLRGRPMAVGGDPEARHGIVLAKDMLAKKAGVKTGMALWQARQVCPDITFVPPRMDLYLRYSGLARQIYADYTDCCEPFGIDESWLDVTASSRLFGSGRSIAEEIRTRIKKELGVTVSIGVSWNKIFAKFGSDYKKPDAITVIDPSNYQHIVWPQAVEELLYVGAATARKVKSVGIKTVGDLARTDPVVLKAMLGKMGLVLSLFARGEDQTPVNRQNVRAPIKSIGNGSTTPRDLTDEESVRIVILLLSESVAARLRENGFLCRVVEISVRDNELFTFTRQHKIAHPTNISEEIAKEAMALFRANYRFRKPIRSLGVRASDLVTDTIPVQTDLFLNELYRERQHLADRAVDSIRKRFGFDAVTRGTMYEDPQLSKVNIKEDHATYPRGYFAEGNQSGV